MEYICLSMLNYVYVKASFTVPLSPLRIEIFALLSLLDPTEPFVERCS